MLICRYGRSDASAQVSRPTQGLGNGSSDVSASPDRSAVRTLGCQETLRGHNAGDA